MVQIFDFVIQKWRQQLSTDVHTVQYTQNLRAIFPLFRHSTRSLAYLTEGTLREIEAKTQTVHPLTVSNKT